MKTLKHLVMVRDRGEDIRIWDTTRRAIEMFDKSIVETRRSFLTIIGLAGTVAITLLTFSKTTSLEVTQTQIGDLVTGFGIFLIAFSIIFWAIEVHYHSYLIVSAATARRLEKKMGLYSVFNNPRTGVTYETFRYRLQQELIPKFYHFIYLVPAFMINIVMILLNSDELELGTIQGTIINGCWIMLTGFFIVLWKFTDYHLNDFIRNKKKSDKSNLFSRINLALSAGLTLIISLILQFEIYYRNGINISSVIIDFNLRIIYYSALLLTFAVLIAIGLFLIPYIKKLILHILDNL